MSEARKPHSGQEIVNILKAGMPWPEPSDGGWHWAMPPIASMEKARRALGEVQGLVEQLEALRDREADLVDAIKDLLGTPMAGGYEQRDATAAVRSKAARLLVVSNPTTTCRHVNTTERPKYAIDDPPGHYLCLDCGDTFPLIGDTDKWKPKAPDPRMTDVEEYTRPGDRGISLHTEAAESEASAEGNEAGAASYPAPERQDA